MAANPSPRLSRAEAQAMSASRPIRVLHLRDSPWVDGPGRTILETATHLDPRHVEYHVGALAATTLREHPLIDALQGRGAAVHRLVDRGGLDRILIGDLVRLIDELQIDVLHSSEFRSNVLALLCRRERPVKLVSTVHGWIANDWRGRAYRVIDKTLLRWFDGVILVSNAMRRLVPRWWLPDRRVCVLHNALVLEKYGNHTLERMRRVADPSGTITLLNVGRLSPEKGQDLLLQAVAALARDYPGLRLKFAGIGPQEGPLRELANSLGIAQRVDFLGYIADMPALYADVDLLVQSSLTEGLPNVILEAAYLRLPIVATAVGGTAEVVGHERSAWLIQPGCASELEQGIRRFLTRPEEFARMAQTGHEDVRSQFSFDARTQRLTQFYQSLYPERT